MCAAFAERGTRLIRMTEDITEVFDEKLRVLSIYASQFKLSHIAPVIRSAAEHEGTRPEELREAYYKMENVRQLPKESRLCREWASLSMLRKKMPWFLRRCAKSRYLTIITLDSGQLGNWNICHEVLISAFQQAELRMYVSEGLQWQIRENLDNTVRFWIVRRGWWRWIWIICWALIDFRTAIIVLHHDPRRRPVSRAPMKAMKTACDAVLRFRGVLLARALLDVCGVISEELGILQPHMRTRDE